MSCLVQNVETLVLITLTAKALTVFDNKIYKPPYLHTKDNMHENLDSSALIDPSLCKLPLRRRPPYYNKII